MILAIVFAQVWGIIQLLVLGSLARTVRVRTVIAAMAVGLYAIAPVTVILQKTWIGVVATVVGKSMADMTGIASYTVDPFIEEALKLLPLVLLMLIPAIRRQWSITDCVLIAAAIGSGFGLAEHLYRYASSPDAAEAVRGGWAMSFGRYTPMVPGIASSLTSWLPNGVWFPEDPTRVNWHLAWSAIGGLAVGLTVRKPTRAARVTAGGLLLLIALDHAAGNTHDIGNTWLAFLAAPLDLVTTHLALLTFVALVAAWWLDRRAQPASDALEPLLAAERSASPRIVGTFTAATKRLPWSIPWVFGFDRARRAYHAAHAAAPESVKGMLEALVAERDRVEQKLAQPEAPPLIPPAWTPTALRGTLRQRPVIISLVLLAPSILYLIVGGFPKTAWVQTLMIAPVVWQVVLLITVLAQARLVWNVAKGMRNLRKTSRLPIGDDAAILGLQLACGIGSVALGGFTLMRVLSGVSAGSTLLSHAHAAEAANRLKPGGGVSVANSGNAFDPSSDSNDADGAADGAAAAAAATGGGAFDPPPPSPELPRTSADDAADASRPARDAATAAEAQAKRAAEDAKTAEEDAEADRLSEQEAANEAAEDPDLPANKAADAAEAAAQKAAAQKAAEEAQSKAADEAAAARADKAEADAEQAQADAKQAEADAQAAAEDRRAAINAQDSADIKRATGDANSDPDVIAAQESARTAHDASEQADKAALDGDDPWDPDAPNKTAADGFHDDAKAADKAVQDAKDDYWSRQNADAEAAKAAASNSQDALDAANAKAAAAQQNATDAAREAARAGDPLGTAADAAAKEAAAAQQREWDAFQQPDADAYRVAREAAIAAQQRADAAKAAADAAHATASDTPWTHKKP